MVLLSCPPLHGKRSVATTSSLAVLPLVGEPAPQKPSSCRLSARRTKASLACRGAV